MGIWIARIKSFVKSDSFKHLIAIAFIIYLMEEYPEHQPAILGVVIGFVLGYAYAMSKSEEKPL